MEKRNIAGRKVNIIGLGTGRVFQRRLFSRIMRVLPHAHLKKIQRIFINPLSKIYFMKKRNIAGRKVNAIGLGGMALDEYKPSPKEKEAIEFLKFAVDSGAEFIDTADVYGLGRNEILIGKALNKEQKEKIVIATKAGCTRPGGFGWGTDGRPEHIKKSIYESFDRLGMKRLFLYQFHAPDQNVPIKKSLQAFKELQQEGLIKNIGVCNFSLEELKEAQKTIDVASVQNHFNLAHKTDEKELLPYLTENNITFLPYFPLGSGRLLQHPKIKMIAEQSGITSSQVALSWIIKKWPTAIPIPGTSKKEHFLENIKAGEIKITDEIVEELDRLF